MVALAAGAAKQKSPSENEPGLSPRRVIVTPIQAVCAAGVDWTCSRRLITSSPSTFPVFKSIRCPRPRRASATYSASFVIAAPQGSHLKPCTAGRPFSAEAKLRGALFAHTLDIWRECLPSSISKLAPGDKVQEPRRLEAWNSRNATDVGARSSGKPPYSRCPEYQDALGSLAAA